MNYEPQSLSTTNIFVKIKFREFPSIKQISAENKILYCNQLLDLASVLSPGQSDLRGYLLWERYGAEKANNTASLNHLTETLREVVTIFGDIREDCVEGESGKKVRRECLSEMFYLCLNYRPSLN